MLPRCITDRSLCCTQAIVRCILARLKRIWNRIFDTNCLRSIIGIHIRRKFGAVTRIVNKTSYTQRRIYPIYKLWNMLKCCLCEYRTSSINNLYKHSNERHYQEINSHSRYSLTSCIRCTFTHANPTITKLHTELIHRPENKVLYITHHRFVSRARAIQQAPNPLDIPNTVAVTKLFGELRTKFHR